MQLTNRKRAAELVGVTCSAPQSAIVRNKIPEPETKIGSHKLIDAEEVGAARRYFGGNRKRRAAGRRS